MDKLTLSQIQERIEFTRSKIEQFFKTMNTPDNVLISKDPAWGRRNITVFVRLDEFSLEKLEEQLPRLKSLFQEYQQLRSVEKERTEKALIERRIQQDALSDIREDS